MMMSVRQQVYAFLVASLCVELPYVVQSQTCAEELNGLASQATELVTTSEALYSHVGELCDPSSGNPDVCRIEGGEDSSAAVTVSHMNATMLYNNYVEECTALGYDVCSANVVFESSAGPLTLLGRPVCAPPSCGVTDLEAVVSTWENPLCDDDDESCTLQSASVTCDPAKSVAEGTCQDDIAAMEANVDGTYDDLQTAKNLLDAWVASSCASSVFGAGGDVCQVTAHVKGQMFVDFDALVSDPTYTDFQAACDASGGKLCKSSFTFSFEGSLNDISTELLVDVKQAPMCFPASCSRQEAFDVIQEFIGSLMASDEVTQSVTEAAQSQRRILSSTSAIPNKNKANPATTGNEVRRLDDILDNFVAQTCNSDVTNVTVAGNNFYYTCQFTYTFFQCDGGEPFTGSPRESVTASVMGYALSSGYAKVARFTSLLSVVGLVAGVLVM